MTGWRPETFAPNALPAPRRDLEGLASDLERFGYCLLESALDERLLQRLRARLDEQAAAEEQAGIAYFDGAPHQNWGRFRDADGRPRTDRFSRAAGGVNQRLWMLVNKGDAFVELLSHATVRALIDRVLGDAYLLSSYIANIANPGGEPMPLHTDQWWAPPATRRGRAPLPVGSVARERFDDDGQGPPPMIAPAACCNVMWMLDDFSEANGATRLVPGSHLSGVQPSQLDALEVRPVAACAAAGTAMVFEGRLWHGTGANVGTAPRRGLLTTFCGPQYRAQENYTVGVRPEVLERASEDLRALLGFRVWGGYGRTDSPLVDFIGPHEPAVGEMRPLPTRT